MIAQHQTEAATRPSMTSLTTTWACQNRFHKVTSGVPDKAVCVMSAAAKAEFMASGPRPFRSCMAARHLPTARADGAMSHERDERDWIRPRCALQQVAA